MISPYSAVNGSVRHVCILSDVKLYNASVCRKNDVVIRILICQELSQHRRLVEGVFERHLLAKFVDSPIFSELINFLTEHQKEEDYLDPGRIVDELVQSGNATQAKEVEKACRGAHGKYPVCLRKL